MVRGMDQGSISERVGCDTHGSHEMWSGVGKLLKILQITKQRQPSFCTPAFILQGQACFSPFQEILQSFVTFTSIDLN